MMMKQFKNRVEFFIYRSQQCTVSENGGDKKIIFRLFQFPILTCMNLKRSCHPEILRLAVPGAMTKQKNGSTFMRD